MAGDRYLTNMLASKNVHTEYERKHTLSYPILHWIIGEWSRTQAPCKESLQNGVVHKFRRAWRGAGTFDQKLAWRESGSEGG